MYNRDRLISLIFVRILFVDKFLFADVLLPLPK